MRPRPLYPEALLVALATLLLEVSYTRVFSFKLVYYFTYLIIGIALLGLGAGGVFVAIFPRLRRAPIERLLPRLCLAAAASVFAGYFVVALTPLNAFQLVAKGVLASVIALEILKLVLICLTVFLPFLCAGLVLSIIFSTQSERIAKLYFADLVGAALACILVIPLLASVGPPGAVMLAGAFFASAGLRLALAGTRGLLFALAAAGLALLGFGLVPSRLPDPVTDSIKTLAPGPQGLRPEILFSRWSPVFRVDAIPYLASVELIHDGTLGSMLYEWSGDLNSLSRFDADDRQLPFRLLPPGPRVAIVGAAGGHEILASLWFRASRITGIELNPVTWSLVTRHFADFGGHVAEQPGVSYVNAEGRSYLKGSPDTYDLIWLVAPDSYAAMNAATAGAFVLSESYLYTEEMIRDALARLREGGILCVQFGEVDYARKPNRTLRYLATARSALRREGARDFADHVLVATSPGYATMTTATVLLKRTPFSAEERATFAATVKERVSNGVVRHDGIQDRKQPVNQVISLPDDAFARWLAAWPFEVHAISDDSPFFWHFVSFRDVIAGFADRGTPNPEEGQGERLLLILLVVAIAFAAAFLLAPLLVIQNVWREIPHKRWAGLYFAALGMGFMFLEVSLIQRLTLFLGYPTYSLTVTLFALLLSTAVGSLLSDRYAGRRNRSLLVILMALAGLVLLYLPGLPALSGHGVGWPLPLRVAITIAVLAPLGVCLGALMPLGLRSVAAAGGPHGQAFVAWSWAVNGFFSVVSSVLSTILSMTLGFDQVMLCALAIYALGVAALLRIPAPPPARPLSGR